MDTLHGSDLVALGGQWEDFQQRRNIWCARNFPSKPTVSAIESMMGVWEELGELAHAHLKARQAIRGDAFQHATDARDAVGDATVYLWGITNYAKIHFDNFFWELVRSRIYTPRAPTLPDGIRYSDIALLEINKRAAQINELVLYQKPPEMLHVGLLVAALWRYCIERDAEDWSETSLFADYPRIVKDTWEHVEKRDWVKHRETGEDVDQAISYGGSD